MTRQELLDEIIKTCRYFKIIKGNYDYVKTKESISKKLNDISFVESLLKTFYSKMKQKRFRKGLNKERLKKLIIELEIMRTNLEFRGK